MTTDHPFRRGTSRRNRITRRSPPDNPTNITIPGLDPGGEIAGRYATAVVVTNVNDVKVAPWPAIVGPDEGWV